MRQVKEEADRLGLRTKCITAVSGTERGGKPFSRGHIYGLLSNSIYTGRIAHKGELYPGQHPALIDDETWAAARDQLAANASNHQRKGKAAEPSLLAGLLVDAEGERLTPSHAVKKDRRYRYYISAALINEAGTDQAQGFRLAAREIEEVVIRILCDALTNPAKLLERLGTAAMSNDKIRKILGRANRLAVALKGSPGEQARGVRKLVEKVLVSDNTIMIRVRRRPLVDRDVASSGSEDPIELTARLALKRHGAETKLVLPGLAQQIDRSRCDPALMYASAEGYRLIYITMKTSPYDA